MKAIIELTFPWCSVATDILLLLESIHTNNLQLVEALPKFQSYNYRSQSVPIPVNQPVNASVTIFSQSIHRQMKEA
jgi:hypothetical protein